MFMKVLSIVVIVLLSGCSISPYKELEQVSKTCENSQLKGYIHKDETLHLEIECKEGKEDD